MPHVTSHTEYFLLASAAYADLVDSLGHENLSEQSHDPLGYAHYEMLKLVGWRVIFSASGRQGYRGYVFVHEARQEICVAHRGTQNLGSIMTDILAVIGDNRTGQVIDAVKETLGNEMVASYLNRGDWTLSTTGHSLGGWLATLFQFVVSDIGMGFHFSGQVACRTFDAPGIGEFLEKLQSPDSRQQVYVPGLDCINYVVRADVVNTLNRQTGTVVCIEGDNAASPRAIQDLLQISDIHGRANIYQALEAHNYKLMQRWPQTSSDVLAMLASALSGNRLALLGITASIIVTDLATNAVNFIRKFFTSSGQATAYSDADIQAARDTLEQAMKDDLRILDYHYDRERQMRHIPNRIGQFIVAYCAYKKYSVMPYLLHKLDLSESQLNRLNAIQVERRAQADWVVLDSTEARGAQSLDAWMEGICELAQQKPELLDLPANIWSYYDTAAQQVPALEEKGRITGERLLRLAEEVASLKATTCTTQAAVMRIGCAHATGKGAFAQSLWSLSADDLQAMETRATQRAVESQISTHLFGAEAYGEYATALAETNLIPGALKSEENILKAFEKCVDSAQKARRELREDMRQGKLVPQLSSGTGIEAEGKVSSSTATGLTNTGMFSSTAITGKPSTLPGEFSAKK